MSGDIYLDGVEALNNTLYISKYMINKDKKYKKDKKRVKKMLEDLENGNFSEYLKNPDDEDEYNEHFEI